MINFAIDCNSLEMQICAAVLRSGAYNLTSFDFTILSRF